MFVFKMYRSLYNHPNSYKHNYFFQFELLKAVLKGYKGLHTSNMIIILAVLTVYESEYIVDSWYNFDFAVNGGDQDTR